MSSSDEESLSERSCVSERSFRSERSGGSLSPCPHSTTGPKGDTLPWNLAKHERRKRKSQGSVLDPAERAVVRVAGRNWFQIACLAHIVVWDGNSGCEVAEPPKE